MSHTPARQRGNACPIASPMCTDDPLSKPTTPDPPGPTLPPSQGSREMVSGRTSKEDGSLRRPELVDRTCSPFASPDGPRVKLAPGMNPVFTAWSFSLARPNADENAIEVLSPRCERSREARGASSDFHCFTRRYIRTHA